MVPTWRGGTPIRCVGGRGPLDDAAATMLAQLLNKHGLGTDVVPHESVSRVGINRFGNEGVAMICVCYLDVSGTTSALRFLLRRLRQRVPGAQLLVALWPQDHPVMSEESVRATLGAEDYVTSLQEAVNACLKASRDVAAICTRPSVGEPPKAASATRLASRTPARLTVSGGMD